jgi:NADH-quinone oxidoreductase subunit N
MVMVGVAFKLSAVPFHFWAPDVFEGAPAEVAAFLSIASKAAALGLLVRLTMGLCSTAAPAAMEALEPARQFTAGLVALLAVITCTFGNLAAYGQTNMKRLLAYSTIAHAGYMMMPVAAALALAGHNPGQSQTAVAALAFYIGLYLFMNLGAFAGVAFLRNSLQSEAIDDYAGLIRKSPGLALCLSIILFSLVGLPPLAGFAGKFTIFAALFDARLLTVLVIGGLNTVLSLFYYLRVVKVMTLSAEPASRPAPAIGMASAPGLYCLIVTAPVVIFGVWWNGLLAWAEAAAKSFLG